MKLSTASAAALSAAIGLLAIPATQTRAVPLTPTAQTAALPAAARHLTGDAEQCQVWIRSYASWNNANQQLRDYVCWTNDPPVVHTTTMLRGTSDDPPPGPCTLTPAHPDCSPDVTFVKARFHADFTTKQVTENTRACPDNRCSTDQHVYSFQ
ncbi:hypothetical protein [Actinoallomurus rhizosphaericola]|uniref:hypothetical protein n=1 Tax=Actinoallomurus rhizosphaericola TaxID=2952536 RepID=UPI00209395F4|nr:hypothetical protein [Actinoallomurus rhizosphaericola]MCO5999372.1 hypothetical protein [Actinoallomurus rhizosphaericola]